MKKTALVLILFQLIGCAKQPVPVIKIYPNTELKEMCRQQINDQIMKTESLCKEMTKHVYITYTGILILMGVQLAELLGTLSREKAFSIFVFVICGALLRGFFLETKILDVFSNKEKKGESKCKHTTTK